MKAYGGVVIYIHVFLNSPLVGGEWSASLPVALPRGKSSRRPFGRRLGGPQNRSRQRRENSWPYRDSNSDPSAVQSVGSRYTDWAILAPNVLGMVALARTLCLQMSVPVFLQWGMRFNCELSQLGHELKNCGFLGSIFHNVQSDFRAHPAFYPKYVYWGLYPGW
jgi:hypothetical protein